MKRGKVLGILCLLLSFCLMLLFIRALTEPQTLHDSMVELSLYPLLALILAVLGIQKLKPNFSQVP